MQTGLFSDLRLNLSKHRAVLPACVRHHASSLSALSVQPEPTGRLPPLTLACLLHGHHSPA